MEETIRKRNQEVKRVDKPTLTGGPKGTVLISDLTQIIVAETRNNPELPSNRVTILPEVGALCAVAGVEAKGLDHGYVGTEHLLLAIMARPESLSAQVITANTGIDYAKMKELVIKKIGDPHQQLERVQAQRDVETISKGTSEEKEAASNLLSSVAIENPDNRVLKATSNLLFRLAMDHTLGIQLHVTPEEALPGTDTP